MRLGAGLLRTDAPQLRQRFRPRRVAPHAGPRIEWTSGFPGTIPRPSYRRTSLTVSEVRFTPLALYPPAAMALPSEFPTEYQYGR